MKARMKQRGMALLTVLLLLAVMVALAAVVAERWGLSFQYSLHLHQRLQGKEYANGGEKVAGSLLQLDALDDARHTHFSQRWATTGKNMPLEDARLQMDIADAQACFNLNALEDDNARDIFTRLLILNGIDASQASRIAAAAADWIATEDTAQSDGAKDSDYAALSPPYLVAAQPFWDISELRQVRGVDADLLTLLSPLLCALPTRSLAINLNTLREAHWTLLASLVQDTGKEDIYRWLAQRPDAGWNTLEASFAGLKPLAGQRRFITLNSDYFTVLITVRMTDSTWRQRSLLQRRQGAVQVLWRRQEAEEE